MGPKERAVAMQVRCLSRSFKQHSLPNSEWSVGRRRALPAADGVARAVSLIVPLGLLFFPCNSVGVLVFIAVSILVLFSERLACAAWNRSCIPDESSTVKLPAEGDTTASSNATNTNEVDPLEASHNSTAAQICAVCYDDNEDVARVQLSCGHSFHSSCIDQQLAAGWPSKR